MLNPVFSTNMPETGNTPIMRAQLYFGLVCGFKGTEVDTGDHRAMGAGDSSAKQAAAKNNNEVSND